MKLRTRLNIMLIPAVAFGFLVAIIITTYLSVNALHQSTNDSLKANGDLIEKSIFSWIKNNKDLINSLANSPIVKQPLTSADKHANMSAHFESLATAFDFRNIALLDEHGIAIAASNPNRIGQNYQQLEYVKQAKLSADIGVNTKYLSHVINKHKKKDFNNITLIDKAYS